MDSADVTHLVPDKNVIQGHSKWNTDVVLHCLQESYMPMGLWDPAEADITPILQGND